MIDVIAGPYRSETDLEALFNGSVTVQADVVDTPQVVLTKDWAERQNAWDNDYVGILVTENDLKLQESDYPLRYWPLELYEKKDFIAGPDSLEVEDNAVEIARGKQIIGLLDPVNDATPKELAQALDAIGAEDSKHVIVLAEDRESILPKALKKASVWDDVKDQELVKECFEQGAEFPGKRINELVNAVGGVANFLDRYYRAKEELRAEGIEVADTHTARGTYYAQFLEYDESQPLPKEGIFISAIEEDRVFLPVTAEDMEHEARGHQLDLNDFNVPADYVGMQDDEGRLMTMSWLRSDRDNDYFTKGFISAKAMRALAELMHIPELETPRQRSKKDVPDAKFISNLNMGEFACKFDFGDEIGRYRRVKDRFRIESHEDLELAFLHADATVIEQWPKQAPLGVQQAHYELEQKLIARMMISNRTTLKPLGEASAKGRPLMINRDVRTSEMGSYANAMKYRAVTSRADHVYKSFYDERSFMSTMKRGQWDIERMKPMPEDTPYYNMMNYEELCDTVGHQHLGFVDALLGSASSHLKSGNQDALHYAKESAKKTITLSNGGGGHYIMGKFIDGPAEAQKEGYDDFLCLMHRVPIASRKEGSLKPVVRRHELELNYGSYGDYHMAFGDEKFHSLTFDYMGERQQAILGPAHVVTSFIGGSGTDYEHYAAMYHNLMVEMRGQGIFPGFEDDQKKRIHFVNSEVPNGGERTGFFDALRDSFTEEQREILNIHFYDSADEALEARDRYAASLGFDLNAPRGTPASYGLDEQGYDPYTHS